MTYALAVDIGTTSLKVGVISDTGEVVFVCRKEFCGERLFRAAEALPLLEQVFMEWQEPLAQRGIVISGIAVSGNGPSLVTDQGLTFLWNESGSGSGKGLPSNEKKILKKSKSLFLPRLCQFRAAFPREFEGSSHIFSGPEFLIFQLTGRTVTILPEERFKSAYWLEHESEALALTGRLPPFVSTCADCGIVRPELAERFGFLSGVRVFAGGPDFVVALIGTNTLSDGRLCDRAGSSEGFNFCVSKFFSARGLRTLPSVVEGLWNVSALIPDSGSLCVRTRLRKVCRAVGRLRRAAARNGMDFPLEMTVTGGQAHSELLVKEKAEALGMRLLHAPDCDSELLGDACAAFVGLGVFSSLREAADRIVRVL